MSNHNYSQYSNKKHNNKGGNKTNYKPKVELDESVTTMIAPEEPAEIKMEVKVGDKVILSKYSGTEVKIDGETLIVVRQGDILAIVE